MLANIIQWNIAVRVAPQPSFRPVVSRAILIATRQIPERHSHLLTVHPFPHVPFPRITHCAHPVLRRRIASVPAPQFPANESLKRWIRFINQRTTASPTERQSIAEVQWLSIVEYVAFAVVRRRGTWRLVAENRTAFDGQRLVSVDECLADGQRTGSVRFEVNGHEGAGHGRIAGQEKGLALFQETGEAIADGICTEVGSVVSDSYDNGGRGIVAWREKKW